MGAAGTNGSRSSLQPLDTLIESIGLLPIEMMVGPACVGDVHSMVSLPTFLEFWRGAVAGFPF